jgi:hypothetical protein
MSPVSRVRRPTPAPQSLPSNSATTQEVTRQRYRRKRRLIRIGQVIMVAAALLALEHVGAHLGAFGGQPSILIDLIAGWPLAGLLFIFGAMFAGQRR